MKKIVLINLIMALFMIIILSLNTGSPFAVVTTASGYYVGPEGSDRNPGTSAEKPWKTIQKAADSAVPGSTVYIKEGTYYERIAIHVSGNEADGAVTFTNYNGGQVIIDGSKTSASDQADMIEIRDQSYIRLVGLEITNNVNADADHFITGIGVFGTGKGIEIRDCLIHHIWYTNSSARNGATAIAVYGSGQEPISDLVIDGNEIMDVKCGTGNTTLIGGNVDGFRFTDNDIHDTTNTGLAMTGIATPGIEPEAEKNLVRNGFVAYNKMIGNSSVENPCYAEGSYAAAGILADSVKEITITGNLCRENDKGIVITSEEKENACGRIVVNDNLILGSNTSGLSVGGSDTGKGWAADSKFINNTLYMNDTKNIGNGEIYIAKSHDIELINNIVYTGTKNLVLSMEDLGKDGCFNIALNHNIYYGPGGAKALRFKGVGTGLVGMNMWKNKTGQDKHSKIADPGFVDSAGNDFRLRQNSAAIDFGDSEYITDAEATDMAGNNRVNGAAIDCGAFETL